MTVHEHIEAVTNEVLRNELTLREATRNFERMVLIGVLTESNWKMGKTAEMLGVHRNTLTRKVAELGILTRRPATV